MTRRPAALVVAVILAALAVSAPITLARFTATSASGATFGTATLMPPTAVNGTGGSSASLTWTASSSVAASGYQLLRSPKSGSGYTNISTVNPVSATATTDAPGAGVWYYVLDTYFGNWTSATSNEAAVTISLAPQTTPLVGCADQAPVTVDSGDNNGYEGTPANGCVKDNRLAKDNNSGTNTVLNCSDPGKDRHQFWGYAFGLPGTVSSVNGITVQFVMGLGSNNGTSQVCAQLSWDGGTSWTAAKSVAITSTSLLTYTLGSPTDTWGHAGWTAAELSAANFRVRLTDMSTVSSKDFKLDFLGASVSYTP